MDNCLAYFRSALQHPDSVPPWAEWWQINEALVRQSFDRADFLNLKFRRLDAARAILQRIGDPIADAPQTFPVLSPAAKATIEKICHSSNSTALLDFVAALDSAQALQHVAYLYNWDDGFAVPTALATHPLCDLGLALDLFWLAEALCWYQGEITENEYNREWVTFCRLVTDGILNGRYHKNATSFQVGLGVARLHELRKQGVPEILFNDVHGQIPPYGSAGDS
jgi:hypothetical protein